jgi:hypothetical protein
MVLDGKMPVHIETVVVSRDKRITVDLAGASLPH